MEDINNRVYELKKAAIACGLEPDQAVDDVAEACGVAMQIDTSDWKIRKYNNEEEYKLAKWWPAFFKDYSGRCVGRWQAKCGKSRNYEAMKALWIESFEPMWLAGCDYVKELAVQNVKGEYDKQLPKYIGRFSDEDSKKFKDYFNSVANDLEKAITSEIGKFKILQRETLFKVIGQARQYYDGETMGLGG